MTVKWQLSIATKMIDDFMPKFFEEGKKARYRDEFATGVHLKMDQAIVAKLNDQDAYQYLGRIFF